MLGLTSIYLVLGSFIGFPVVKGVRVCLHTLDVGRVVVAVVLELIATNGERIVRVSCANQIIPTH